MKHFLFYGAFYISLTVIIFCFVWAKGLNKIDVRIYMDTDQSQVGSITKLIIEVENNSLFPVMWGHCWIEMPAAFGLQDNQACYLFSVGSHGKTRIEDDLPCLQRGSFEWGQVVVKTGDPFGLFVQTNAIHFESTLNVWPQVLNFSSTTKFTENDQYIMRQYVSGDSMSRVNWKMSARKHALFVREQTEKGKPDIIIGLDNHQDRHHGCGPESSFETGVTITASLAASAMKKGYGVRLRTSHSGKLREQIYKHNIHGHLNALLNNLTQLQMTIDGAKDSTGFVEMNQFVKVPAFLYMITGVLDDRMMNLLMNYQKRGCRCTVFFLMLETFGAGKLEGDRLSNAPGGSGIKIIHVDKNTNLSLLMRRAEYEAG